MTEIILLPCPFCGGEAVMEEIEEKIFGSVRFSVGCATEDEATCMGYQSLTSFARRGDAASAWNTRAAPAARKHAGDCSIYQPGQPCDCEGYANE